MLGKGAGRKDPESQVDEPMGAVLEVSDRVSVRPSPVGMAVVASVTVRRVGGSSRRSSIQRLSEIVDPAAIDFGGRTSPEGAVTIGFSDIEGSAEMVERLGDLEWVRVLRVHNELVRLAVARNGGIEVKAQGDGFMLAFVSSLAALRCAIEMQRLLERYRAEHEEFRVRVRVGLHAGFMVQEGADYFGRDVILAARIADHARGGEVLVSEPLKEFVEDAEGTRLLEPRQLVLKGLSGRHRVYPVEWRIPD